MGNSHSIPAIFFLFWSPVSCNVFHHNTYTYLLSEKILLLLFFYRTREWPFYFFNATPLQLDSYEIAEGKSLKINVSEPKTRLFLGNIPKSKDKEEIEEELRKLTGKIKMFSCEIAFHEKKRILDRHFSLFRSSI